MTLSFRRLRLQQVEKQAEQFREARLSQPSVGWIRQVRGAIGMRAAQLAARMGISQPAVSALERSEREGSITLASLRKAADALGCDLVYGLVPKSGTLTEIVEEQARKVSSDTMKRVSHSMMLEGQSVDPGVTERQIEELVKFYMDNLPKDLWEESKELEN